jgi:hypothetical protein
MPRIVADRNDPRVLEVVHQILDLAGISREAAVGCLTFRVEAYGRPEITVELYGSIEQPEQDLQP